MAPDEDHTFFTLPTELHTYIFTLACTPSSARICAVGPSYYTAFLTGLALSLVSKYFHIASAPARHRAVVIYGWQELLAFERVLLTRPRTSTSCSRVRYLTLIADELPHPALQAKVNETELEESFLDAIARILRVVGKDLYELELGFQAIENIKDPLTYLSLSGPGSPLSFPTLETMFYACSPSNVLPWVTASTILNSSSPANTPQTIPHILCPCLEELTVVCNTSTTSDGLQFADAEQSGIHEYAAETLDGRGIITTAAAEETHVHDNEPPVIPIMQVSQFLCLKKLTILASTPKQALIALDTSEAAWDVGLTLGLHLGGLERKTKGEEKNQEAGKWPPETLQTVILRPKSHWNERWASLRDVVRRQREEMEATRVRSDVFSEGLFEIFVLKPGEQV